MSDMGDDYHRNPRRFSMARGLVWLAAGAASGAIIIGLGWLLGQILMGLR